MAFLDSGVYQVSRDGTDNKIRHVDLNESTDVKDSVKRIEKQFKKLITNAPDSTVREKQLRVVAELELKWLIETILNLYW